MTGVVEFVPRGVVVWQSEQAKTYQCPQCLEPVRTQYEGDRAQVTEADIECLPEGHRVRLLERN